MDYPSSLDYFSDVVFGDTEYHAPAGQNPQGICVVLAGFKSQRVTQMWTWRRGVPECPEVLRDPHTLFVSYSLPAEYSVFQAFGWPLPSYGLDLNVETRCVTNGLTERPFISLLEAAERYHIPYLDKHYKDLMRDIAIAGGSEVEASKPEMLKYCEDDTLVMIPLLKKLLPELSLPHALFRGQFMRCQAQIERRAIPIDVQGYQCLIEHRQILREQLAQKANADLGRDPG